MEAGNEKRAALRLTAAAAGVLVTLLLASATVRMAIRPAHRAVLTESAPLAASAEWREGQPAALTRASRMTDDAYQPTSPWALAQAVAGSDDSGFVWQPPEVTPVAPVATDAIDRVVKKTIEAQPAPASPWSGPVTIHNPAAMGPPEDDTIPAAPLAFAPTRAARTVADAPRVARRAPSTLFAPANEAPETDRQTAPPAFEERTPSETETPNTTARLPRATPRTIPAAATSPLTDDELLSYTASLDEISPRLMPEVQAGFRLGKSGAIFAARGRFVAVLRRLALAKDAAEGSTEHSRALADGLRTLDEADDFVPRGDALEAELDVAAIARSHSLDLLGGAATTAPPHEAVAIYSRHAARRLGEAVAGEQAGSMALYGLGKTYARLEAQSDDPSAGRKSTAMFQAALDAHGDNYLAANELGVRLARSGRYEQAESVLRLAAAKPAAPSTVFENLAMVEQKLGQTRLAQAAGQRSERLAQTERATGAISRQRGIQWVSPDAFRRSSPATTVQSAPAASAPPPIYTAQPAVPTQPTGPEPSAWSKALTYAKRTTGWSTPASAPPAMATRPAVPQQRVIR